MKAFAKANAQRRHLRNVPRRKARHFLCAELCPEFSHTTSDKIGVKIQFLFAKRRRPWNGKAILVKTLSFANSRPDPFNIAAIRRGREPAFDLVASCKQVCFRIGIRPVGDSV